MDNCTSVFPMRVIIKDKISTTHSAAMETNDHKAPPEEVINESKTSKAKSCGLSKMDGKRTRSSQDHIIIPSQSDHKSLTIDLKLDKAHDTSRGQKQNGVTTTYASMDISGIDSEIAKRNAEATEGITKKITGPGDADNNLVDCSTAESIRARTNTPTGTLCTDTTEFKSLFKSQALDETNRTLVYQQAMSLLTERCPSTALVGHSTLATSRLPSASQQPKYIYVEQNKPTPMPPLQAWRGYNGNVYFEPIKVNTAPQYAALDHQEVPLDKCSDQLQDILKRARRAQSSRELPVGPLNDQDPKSLTKSMTNLNRNSARSGGTSCSPRGIRKMVVLDKSVMFDRNNNNIQEDMIWILGQESTGSLCLSTENKVQRTIHDRLIPSPHSNTQPQQPQQQQQQQYQQQHQQHQQQHQPPSPQPRGYPVRQGAAAQTRSKSTDREKIHRGSVAHKIHAMKNRNQPFFSVTGGRYYQQQLPSSPLLRTQTQYSLSNQRSINSPDLFGGMDKLPPLEQLRASLRHIEPDNQGNVMNVITPLDRIKFEDTDAMTKCKPFVKYSAEVKNSAKLRNRQISLRHQRVM